MRSVYVAIYGSNEHGPRDSAIYTSKDDAQEWIDKNYSDIAPWCYTTVSEKPLNPPISQTNL